jgi:hypothetical protein
MFSANLPTLRPAACTALMCAGRYCRIFFEPYRVISVTRPGSFNGSSTLSEPWAPRPSGLRTIVCICVRIYVSAVCVLPLRSALGAAAAAEPAGCCLTLCLSHARCRTARTKGRT